jgi:hypothetical protein
MAALVAPLTRGPRWTAVQSRVVRAFATWHHLRRLRRQSQPVSAEQL